MIEKIEKLKETAKIMPIVVTDTKDVTLRDRLNKLCENRCFFV